MKMNIRTYLLTVCFLLTGGAMQLHAQTWTGSVSTSWHTAGNWNPNGVPGSNAEVTIPNTANKPEITANITVKSITVNASELYIRNNATVTLSSNINVQAGGKLYVVNGHISLSNGTIDFPYGANRVEVTKGSITIGSSGQSKEFYMNSTSTDFYLGEGTLHVYGDFGLNYGSNNFYAEEGTVIVEGNTTIKGTYYGDDGETTFGGNVAVQSGGKINLDEGSIIFDGETFIGSNATANFGSGTVEFNDDLDIGSSGYLNVQDAYVTVNGNLRLDSSGYLTIDDGTLHITGNTLFSWSGYIDAGNGTIILEGDLSSPTGSTFDAGTSTVIFAGDSQSIDVGSDIHFYDVVIEEGTTVETGVNDNTIYIENDLTIGGGGELNVNGDDKVNVRGDVNGDEDAYSPERPYVVSAVAPDVNTLVLTYNMEMDETTAESTGNYTIRVYNVSHNGSTISVSSATLDTGNNKVVTISMATIQEDVQYEVLVSTSVKATNNKTVSADHYKYFQKTGPVIFYSRQTGDWATNSTWSRTSHTGAAAGENPTNTPNATIYVGNGHTVSISGSASVINQTSLEIKSSSKLLVDSGGTLKLGTKTITGTGTFEVDGGTIEIGSTAGISASGATGNIQTSTRTFKTSGSYTYNGTAAQITGTGLPVEVENFTVDNSAGVTIDEDLTVNGTLSLKSGPFIIESGNNLIAPDKSIISGFLRMKRAITGSKGWRLYSSPLASTYDDFFDGITTQGYLGSSLGNVALDSLQPNVMYYLESYAGTDNQRWRAPADADDNMVAGRGLYTYIFGNVAGDNRYNDNLPATLTVDGQENEGPVNFGITYTTSADSGWSLIGNPYAASIDWDDSPSWTKTNIDNTIYIWDYSTNQYKTWNGTTGDLPNGKIAPFQGFWVKANAASPSLIVDEGAKTTGGTFVGKVQYRTSEEPVPSFSVILSDDNQSAAVHFMFSDTGLFGKDKDDAYRLLPPSGIRSYLDLAGITNSGDRLSINNLPRRFGIPIEIPLYVDAFENGYSVSKPMHFLFGNLRNIPDGWSITLVDTKTGIETDLRDTDTYLFNFEAEKNKPAPNGTFSEKPKITLKAKASAARFVIRIAPGADAADLPNRIELMQNFPNPFNPSTNIRFTLPLQSFVSLKIYDILGREVETLVNKNLQAGEYTYQWNTRGLASGVYLYRLITPDAVLIKKMTLIK